MRGLVQATRAKRPAFCETADLEAPRTAIVDRKRPLGSLAEAEVEPESRFAAYAFRKPVRP